MTWNRNRNLWETLFRWHGVSGGKVSDAEKAAQKQSAAEATQLQGMMTTQFKEQQDLLNKVIIPQLTQMATNPEGFGAKALATMQSQLINTVGSQLSSQEKSLKTQFATSNLPGLPSGVETALEANLNANAAGTEATGIQNISLANEQLKQQQREEGLSGLSQATTLEGATPQSAGLAVQSNQNNFDQSYKMAQQGGGIFSKILSGVIGAGLNFATGGLSSIAQGGSFLAGGGQALAGGG